MNRAYNNKGGLWPFVSTQAFSSPVNLLINTSHSLAKTLPSYSPDPRTKIPRFLASLAAKTGPFVHPVAAGQTNKVFSGAIFSLKPS